MNNYSTIGNVQEPKWRVRALLMKLDSDDKNGTDYFMNKFIHKVKAIFAGLPKQKDWQSFQKNDLPILFTPDQASYLRGKRYNREKEVKGGDRGNQYTVAKDQNDPLPESTADRLATEYKVSAPTSTVATSQKANRQWLRRWRIQIVSVVVEM